MSLKKWEMVGIFLIIGIGIFLYYANNIFNQSQFVILIVPINTSIWEYMKLTFYAMIIFAAIEYMFIGIEHLNFIVTKTISTLFTCFLIPVFFYGYTNFMNQNFYLNMILFAVAIFLGQIVSYVLLKMKLYITGMNFLALIFVFIAIIVFSSYTHQPGTNQLFNDFLQVEP